MDIFISENWLGIIKVILVIMSELEAKILSLSHEEILIFLSDIPKNNFWEVFEGGNDEGSKTFKCLIK